MNALLLSFVLTNQVATVRFTAPVNGSYSVQASEDGLRWRVLLSVPAREGEHVVASERCVGQCKIYRVEWRGVAALARLRSNRILATRGGVE